MVGVKVAMPVGAAGSRPSEVTGEPRPVMQDIEHAFGRAMASDSPWGRGEVGFWMWRLGAIDGPPEGAAEPFALQMAGDWRGAAV